MNIQTDAIALLEAQQAKVGTYSPQWMVGEQLKDICRREPRSAELIARDLENPEMSITRAERKIKEYADKHRKGGFACVIPAKAEEILRKFYGLPSPEAGADMVPPSPPEKAADRKVLKLEDFF